MSNEATTEETSAEVFAESAAISMVTDPATGSTIPKETTRSPDAVESDIMVSKDILKRYVAAKKREKDWWPLDGNPFTELHEKLDHLIREYGWAFRNGNV